MRISPQPLDPTDQRDEIIVIDQSEWMKHWILSHVLIALCIFNTYKLIDSSLCGNYVIILFVWVKLIECFQLTFSCLPGCD